MGSVLDDLFEALGINPDPERVRHSQGVSETCRTLALRWGLDPDRAALTGLLHDCARDLPDENLLQLAIEFRIPVDDIEESFPVLLHGQVGACLIRKYLGILEEEILTAVALHTTGGPDMGLLDKILYVADYSEPGRRLPRTDEVRLASMKDLDLAVLIAMKGTLEYLVEKGQLIHNLSIEGWNWMILNWRKQKGDGVRPITLREH